MICLFVSGYGHTASRHERVMGEEIGDALHMKTANARVTFHQAKGKLLKAMAPIAAKKTK